MLKNPCKEFQKRFYQKNDGCNDKSEESEW